MTNIWNAIIEETEHLIGSTFCNDHGDNYVFFGVVYGGDDYYYGMWNNTTKDIKLLSCVGSLLGHGYEVTENEVTESPRPRMYALLSNQGTAMTETLLTEEEFNNSVLCLRIERHPPADAARPLTWADVSDNDACQPEVTESPSCKYCVDEAPYCDSKAGSWFCTRPPGHYGAHVACGAPANSGDADHEYARW